MNKSSCTFKPSCRSCWVSSGYLEEETLWGPGGAGGREQHQWRWELYTLFPDVPVLQRENCVKPREGESAEQWVGRGLVPRIPGPQSPVQHMHKDTSASLPHLPPCDPRWTPGLQTGTEWRPFWEISDLWAGGKNFSKMKSPKLNSTIFSWLSEIRKTISNLIMLSLWKSA